MNQQWKQRATFVAVLVVLGIIGTAFSPHPATAQNAQNNNGQGAAPVTLVSPLPLPVTGTVAVTGLPTSTTINNGTTNPVPVRDVDAPGRQPFSVWVEFFAGGCSFNCKNFFALGSVLLMDAAPVVPAGKQWVITQVSGRLPSTATYAHFALQDTPIVSLQQVKTAYLGPFFLIANGLLGFNGPVSAVIGPGESAHINILAPTPTNFIGFVTLNGYLIDAPAAAAAASVNAPAAGNAAVPAMLPGSPAGERPELNK